MEGTLTSPESKLLDEALADAYRLGKLEGCGNTAHGRILYESAVEIREMAAQQAHLLKEARHDLKTSRLCAYRLLGYLNGLTEGLMLHGLSMTDSEHLPAA